MADSFDHQLRQSGLAPKGQGSKLLNKRLHLSGR